ncbi:MAG: hypothetical protein VKI39_07720, partial [Synechococcus sp.]|nr:hypothetical protein [Synechococcus sp.]
MLKLLGFGADRRVFGGGGEGGGGGGDASKAAETTMTSAPPATKVENTAGLSIRVNTSSDDPYQVVNDKGYTVFRSSSKSAADKYIKENTKDEYLDARGNTYATQKEADAANKALFAASEQETRRDTAA